MRRKAWKKRLQIPTDNTAGRVGGPLSVSSGPLAIEGQVCPARHGMSGIMRFLDRQDKGVQRSTLIRRAAFVVVLSLSVVLGDFVRALTNGQVDIENTFENVGVFMVVFGPNDLGIPEGTLIDFCSMTLIHERVGLTAGHCTTYADSGVPPFIRPVVSLSPNNPRDPSTWIDVAIQRTHPGWPTCILGEPCPPDGMGGQIPSDTPGLIDVGLLILATPVEGIKPAKLPKVGVFDKNVVAGAPMTVVGYGFTALTPDGSRPPMGDWDGLRRWGTASLENVPNGDWVDFDRAPTGVCFGDSGGPTFFLNHLVAINSDGSEDCASWDHRARVDTDTVLDWIQRVMDENGLHRR
jgi:Trypsin